MSVTIGPTAAVVRPEAARPRRHDRCVRRIGHARGPAGRPREGDPATPQVNASGTAAACLCSPSGSGTGPVAGTRRSSIPVLVALRSVRHRSPRFPRAGSPGSGTRIRPALLGSCRRCGPWSPTSPPQARLGGPLIGPLADRGPLAGQVAARRGEHGAAGTPQRWCRRMAMSEQATGRGREGEDRRPADRRGAVGAPVGEAGPHECIGSSQHGTAVVRIQPAAPTGEPDPAARVRRFTWNQLGRAQAPGTAKRRPRSEQPVSPGSLDLCTRPPHRCEEARRVGRQASEGRFGPRSRRRRQAAAISGSSGAATHLVAFHVKLSPGA